MNDRSAFRCTAGEYNNRSAYINNRVAVCYFDTLTREITRPIDFHELFLAITRPIRARDGAIHQVG